MTWAPLFLIKQAVLYNPAHPNLNWQLGVNAARHNPKIRLLTAGEGSLPKRLLAGLVNRVAPAHTFAIDKPTISIRQGLKTNKGLGMDLTLPGAQGEVLQHELSEASFLPSRNRVVNLSPLNMNTLQRNIATVKEPGWHPIKKFKAMMGIPATIQEGGVSHVDPRVLFQESNRIAAGEVSPEMAQQLIRWRKQTGEYDALRRLGLQYGIQNVPEGGRAWNRLMQRTQKILPARSVPALGLEFQNLNELLRKPNRFPPIPNPGPQRIRDARNRALRRLDRDKVNSYLAAADKFMRRPLFSPPVPLPTSPQLSSHQSLPK